MRLQALILGLVVPLTLTATPVEGQRGMVASASPLASEAGVKMLRAGGNAVDAAVATAFALAVVEPSASGIGGGGFSLSKFGPKLEFLDFREVAPAKATRELFVRDGKPDPTLSRDGVLSVAVPGAVAGYLELLSRRGKLAREQVLAPAIELAEKGFAANGRYLSYIERRGATLAQDPEAASIFMVRGKAGAWEPPAFGAIVKQPELAQTLRAIAKGGAKAFYEGEIAQLLVADMQRRGGLITLQDLAAYKVRERKPLVGAYRGHAIVTAPPPSAGGHIVLSLLAAAESMPKETPRNDPAFLHRYLEMARHAYADRVLFGDPAFTPDPTPQLTNPERLRALIASFPARAAKSVAPGEGTALVKAAHTPAPPDGGPNTTHLSVVDAEGNAVAMTTTVNFWFGAGLVAKGTGVVWNDEMDDFSIGAGVANAWQLEGSEANQVAPGKIPLSSMSPTIALETTDLASKVRLVIGAPGGARIPMQVAAALHAHLGYGLDVQAALTTPKLHHQWSPDVVSFERFALDPLTQEALRKLGYTLDEETDPRKWGNGTAVAVNPVSGLRTGATDPRGAGAAIAE